jgi:hypothetical protein
MLRSQAMGSAGSGMPEISDMCSNSALILLSSSSAATVKNELDRAQTMRHI